jgi:glutathione S-transferase
MSSPTIELLTAATPNGQKISIFLEELGLPYTTTSIDLGADEQKAASFLATNPNGRIPAIIDHSRNSFPVFESGAIFLYLLSHYDQDLKFGFENGSDEWSEMVMWLFFQVSNFHSLKFGYILFMVLTHLTNAGLGPMQGQANHFFRYAPDKIDYGIKRYQNETKRLYSVLESRLQNRKYLVGEKYSVADMSSFTWVRWAPWAGIELDEFPKLKEWADRIESRDAVKRGLRVPGDKEDQIERLRKDPNVGDPFQEWVMSKLCMD